MFSWGTSEVTLQQPTHVRLKPDIKWKTITVLLTVVIHRVNQDRQPLSRNSNVFRYVLFQDTPPDHDITPGADWCVARCATCTKVSACAAVVLCPLDTVLHQWKQVTHVTGVKKWNLKPPGRNSSSQLITVLLCTFVSERKYSLSDSVPVRNERKKH